MAHWHDHNPWAVRLLYIPSIAEAVGESYERNAYQFGNKLDAYLLKQPSGEFCFGIRYGECGSDYLSPWIDQTLASSLFTKYSHTGA